MIHKFEETGSRYDRSRSGRPSVPVEAAADVHEAITEVSRVSARDVSRVMQ